LRGGERKPFGFRWPTRQQVNIFAIVVLAAAAFSGFSVAAITGCAITANLNDADVSIKNAGWKGKEDVLVTGAKLSGRNLERAKARNAFLAKADLQNANLRGADLTKADLRWANLSGAHLDGAVLTGADLSGANFERATMTRTDLRGAKNRADAFGLTRAQLAGALVDR
jgi:uncharacterized protein YjbI with pentapeptide repeats